MQPPVDDVWFREIIAQEAEAWHLDRVAPLLPRVCLNRNQLDLEQIARLCSFDEDRSREGMDPTQVQVLHVLRRRLVVQLSVEGVARLVHNGVARIYLHHRLYGLVPAIVARPWLLAKRLGWIYAHDMLLGHRCPPRVLCRSVLSLR